MPFSFKIKSFVLLILLLLSFFNLLLSFVEEEFSLRFADEELLRSENGLVFLSMYINSFMSLEVESYVDLDTHGLFICKLTEARVMNKIETMTYTYYQNNVKPKPEGEGKKGYVCKVCGYVYEGDELPDDYVCPLCKHGASDFEKIE